MRLIIKIILVIFFIQLCSSLSVGFKTKNKKQKGAILIIGEISERASSIQINNILQQLRIFKNIYAEQNNEMMIEMKLGRRLKTVHNIASLFDADCDEFITFLREKSSQDIEANFGFQIYFNIYYKSSFYIKSVDNLSGTLHLSLDDPVLLELSEMFPESLEVDYQRYGQSPKLEYDEIYGTGNDLKRGLLYERKHYRKSSTFDCCNIS